MRMSPRENFNTKWIPEPNSGCWLWLAALDIGGYGKFSTNRRSMQAHRIGWNLYRGPIPPGMMLDHMCRTRSCVNPDHMRIVTPFENSVENSLGPSALNYQKTHCTHGHPFSGENLKVYANPKLPGRFYRYCRACHAAYYQRKRGRLGLPVCTDGRSARVK